MVREINYLVEGEAYFQVHYPDNEMCVPCVMTMVYLGKDIPELIVGLDKSLMHYCFQDAESYYELGKYNELKPDSSGKLGVQIYTFDNTSIVGVYDFDEMIGVLQECVLRNKR